MKSMGARRDLMRYNIGIILAHRMRTLGKQVKTYQEESGDQTPYNQIYQIIHIRLLTREREEYIARVMGVSTEVLLIQNPIALMIRLHEKGKGTHVST